jgi:acetyl-CoA C-acetyltransferase
VVGVGQTSQRVDAAEAEPPIALLTRAARSADADTGRSLLAKVDIVGIVQIVSWTYADPGAYLARLLGITPRATVVTTTGGNSPHLLVDEFAHRIQRGECDVVLLGGAESMYTRWRARREPRVHLEWDDGGDAACAWRIGDDRPGSSDYEIAHGAVAPTLVYPLFETALRAAERHGIDEHQRYVSEMWSGFATVASGNPHAWSRTAYTPEEIRTVSPSNRMVCFPYPKLMCSNIDVDQAAALLLCSYEAARAAGIADDRMVFLHASAQAHDHWFVSERDTLTDSPAIATAGADALGAAGFTIDDIAHFDLYSCFPAAVQIAKRALGIDEGRPLTVTGGLGFAGGPVNNYPTHAIARMVEILRTEPEAVGLTTALGWYVTKHGVGVWSARPPEAGFRRVGHAETQARVDARPKREPAGLVDGDALVEATSVAFERDGSPSLAIVSAILGDGRRAFASTRDVDVARALTQEPWEGRSVRLCNDSATNTLVP